MKRVIAVAAAVLSCGVTFAQDTFDKEVVNLALLRMAPVQKELKIAPDQTKKMAVIEKDSNAALEKLRKGTTQPTTQQVQAVAKSGKARMIAVLSASQIKRLREITLQTLGPLGIMNPVVQAKLSISKTQKPKLTSLLQKFAPKLAEAARPKESASKPTEAELKKRVAAIDKLQKELAVGIRAVLTPAQLKQYRVLAGKPCPGLQTAARVAL